MRIVNFRFQSVNNIPYRKTGIFNLKKIESYFFYSSKYKGGKIETYKKGIIKIIKKNQCKYYRNN